MSVILTKDDIFQIEKGIIVHGVNCSGGFGSGFAGQIANKWPHVKKEYKSQMLGCSLSSPCDWRMGTIHVVDVAPDLFVINAFTQVKYGRGGAIYANLIHIGLALKKVVEFANSKKLDIHSPKIGTGLGGLSWGEVRNVFLDVAPGLNNPLSLYVHEI